MEKMTSLLRLRMSAKDAHYGGNLVDGAHMVHLFGDVATELLIKCDGDVPHDAIHEKPPKLSPKIFSAKPKSSDAASTATITM